MNYYLLKYENGTERIVNLKNAIEVIKTLGYGKNKDYYEIRMVNNKAISISGTQYSELRDILSRRD